MYNTLLDFDGVVFDLLTAIKWYLRGKGITFIPENVISYDFDGDIGCSKADVFNALKDPSLFENLPLYKGADDAIELLKAVSNVHAYTGVRSDEKIIEYRNRDIANFGVQGSCVYADKNVCRGKKGVVEGDWVAVFEDSLATLKAWENESNVMLFLINHTYNSEVNNPEFSSLWNRVYRCENLLEAVNLFIQKLSEK